MKRLHDDQELALLREAIALAVCNMCEGELTEDDWVVADHTVSYAGAARPAWMHDQGITEYEAKSLLCSGCASTPGYRNHRGPGVAAIDWDNPS